MISDAERREVAMRLRGARYGWRSWERALYDALGVDTETASSDMLDRLADLIEPNRSSGGRTILCAHCESASWCGCEPGDEEGGCDFTQNITEGEPPYNLYSLYEAVLRRHPRDEYAIEDDEVDELVDALIDICNAPGHEVIQRSQPSEPEVRCVAEVKVDGERLERLAHDAAAELTGIDRDALLKLAYMLQAMGERSDEKGRYDLGITFTSIADRIREALGVES